jgi:hypothetical protein
MTKKYNDSLFGENGRFNNSELVQNFINAINALIPENVQSNNLIEGEKVKLNYERITSYPTWTNDNPKYKNFVENNLDTIFTVEFEEKQKKDKICCVLKEDTSPVKWIFYECDLIRSEIK